MTFRHHNRLRQRRYQDDENDSTIYQPTAPRPKRVVKDIPNEDDEILSSQPRRYPQGNRDTNNEDSRYNHPIAKISKKSATK